MWALNINGDNAQIYGVSLQTVAALGAGFSLEASANYLSEYLNPGPNWQIVPRHVLPEVTPFNGDIILRYKKELSDIYTFMANVENAYTGSHYSLEFPNGYEVNGEYGKLPGFDLVNVRAEIVSTRGWTVALFANNITNKHAQLENLFQELEATSAFNRVVTNQPLTAGVDLSLHF